MKHIRSKHRALLRIITQYFLKSHLWNRFKWNKFNLTWTYWKCLYLFWNMSRLPPAHGMFMTNFIRKLRATMNSIDVRKCKLSRMSFGEMNLQKQGNWAWSQLGEFVDNGSILLVDNIYAIFILLNEIFTYYTIIFLYETYSWHFNPQLDRNWPFFPRR